MNSVTTSLGVPERKSTVAVDKNVQPSLFIFLSLALSRLPIYDYFVFSYLFTGFIYLFNMRNSN